MHTSPPTTAIDLFSDETLDDPYPAYADLRASGSAVYLELHDAWALPRYADIRHALLNWRLFSSAQGVALNDGMNTALRGTVLAADPPLHRTLRGVLSERLAPRRLHLLRDDIDAKAATLVDTLVEKGRFDAVRDLARAFPVSVVADLIGIPTEIRDDLLGWADASFNAFGPSNRRTRQAQTMRAAMVEWLQSITVDDLAPGSMGRAIFEAADSGIIDRASCAPLLSAYTVAGIDTTINALSNAVLLFARHPEQWDAVRSGSPAILTEAFNEVLRYDSPVQAFSRVATADVEVGDVLIPEGQRIVVLYGSGNRDGRHYRAPDRFDISRRPSDHLSFGFGIHSCAGQSLARMEAEAILSALAARVKRIYVGTPVRHLNNVVRGLESLPVEHVEVR